MIIQVSFRNNSQNSKFLVITIMINVFQNLQKYFGSLKKRRVAKTMTTIWYLVRVLKERWRTSMKFLPELLDITLPFGRWNHHPSLLLWPIFRPKKCAVVQQSYQNEDRKLFKNQEKNNIHELLIHTGNFHLFGFHDLRGLLNWQSGWRFRIYKISTWTIQEITSTNCTLVRVGPKKDCHYQAHQKTSNW